MKGPPRGAFRVRFGPSRTASDELSLTRPGPAGRIADSLQHDGRAVATDLDEDRLTGLRPRIERLRDGDQNAAPDAEDDPLRLHRLLVLLLHFVAGQCTTKRTDYHRQIASGAATDQASETEARQTDDDGTDATARLREDAKIPVAHGLPQSRLDPKGWAMRLFRILACGLSLAPATAYADTSSRVPMTDDLALLVERAVSDSVKRTGLPAAQLQVTAAEAVTWSDGSLGCPTPGASYTMAEVPGYRIRIQAGARVLQYHASQRGQLLHCPPDRAIEPRREEWK